MVGYALVFVQLLWVLLALLHRWREPTPRVLPQVGLDRAWQGAFLGLPRMLRFVGLPPLRAGAAPAPWLRPGEPAAAPVSAGQALEDLAALARAARGGRLLVLVEATLLLMMGLAPPLAMGLTAWGVTIGDPEAVPDAVAALGAYLVAMAAQWSGRIHTRSSLVWAGVFPLGVVFTALGWTLGAVGGAPDAAPPPPEDPPAPRIDADPPAV